MITSYKENTSSFRTDFKISVLLWERVLHNGKSWLIFSVQKFQEIKLRRQRRVQERQLQKENFVLLFK